MRALTRSHFISKFMNSINSFGVFMEAVFLREDHVCGCFQGVVSCETGLLYHISASMTVIFSVLVLVYHCSTKEASLRLFFHCDYSLPQKKQAAIAFQSASQSPSSSTHSLTNE